MSSKKDKLVVAAAMFGSALATTYVAQEMQADLVQLQFTPSSIFYTAMAPQNVVVDELALGFVQWHDSVGKTMYAQSLTSIGVVSEGAVISPSDVFGLFTINFPNSATGDMFVGFRSAGDVGWFRIEFSTIVFGPIVYGGGEYGDDGESLLVGGGVPLLGDINCDGVVDLLDVQPFVQLLQEGEFNAKADMNGDGTISLLDVDLFVDAVSGG